jgi:hypothetical protein
MLRKLEEGGVWDIPSDPLIFCNKKGKADPSPFYYPSIYWFLPEITGSTA